MANRLEQNTGQFGIRREGVSRPRFEYEIIKDIDIGQEGKKTLAEVKSKKGSHGRYFFKFLSEDSASLHYQKYLELKKRGMTVPKIYKEIDLTDGRHGVIAEDLTNEDKNLVVSANNPEVFTHDYDRIAKKFLKEILEKISQTLLDFVEKSAGTLEESDPVYQLRSDAYLLIAGKNNNPIDAQIIIGDFGNSIQRFSNLSQEERKKIFVDNLKGAATAYFNFTRRALKIPADKIYCSFQQILDETTEDAREILAASYDNSTSVKKM